MTRVGFTGTQNGMTDSQFRYVVTVLAMRALVTSTVAFEQAEFHHGDCVGADAEASLVARAMGFRVVMHPPVDPSKRAFTIANVTRPPAPYLKRNEAIVDETDMLLATPATAREQTRSGTWATIRYALKNGKHVIVIKPDGSVVTHNHRIAV